MIKYLMIAMGLVSQIVSAEPCQTQRKILIDNPDAKVWKSTICPNEKLPFHMHQFSRVVIPSENGILKVVYQSGRVASIQLIQHQPVYLDKAQGMEPHQDVNLSQRALHLTVIELRHPQ